MSSQETEWKLRKAKGDKYLSLAQEIRKLWQVMVIPIVPGTLATIPEGLEIAERIKTIQTTTLLARILRNVLENCGNLLSLRLQWKAISSLWCEKYARNKIMIYQGQMEWLHEWLEILFQGRQMFKKYINPHKNSFRIMYTGLDSRVKTWKLECNINIGGLKRVTKLIKKC